MAGQIITLPVRLGVRAASLLLRGSEAVAGRTLTFALRASGVVRSRSTESGSVEMPPPAYEPVAPATDVIDLEEPAASPPAHVSEEPAHVSEEPVHVSEEPAHVSEEPELVGEFSEPGAEDGAGAQLTVDEPWPGYAQTNAKDVLARLGDASQAELAAIQLYESINQGRQTVLDAVARQLQLASRDG